MRYMLSLRTAGGMWMLMAGLEHLLCSMSAILCVSKWPPVAFGLGPEVGTLTASVRAGCKSFEYG
mgnify:CR=1 FL=1